MPDTPTPPSKTAQLRTWLRQRAENERANLRLFVSGAALFFTGLGLLIYADQTLLASVAQELIAAFGVFMAGIGALLALLGYLALSLFRILRFKDD